MEKWGIIIFGILGVAFILRNSGGQGVRIPYSPRFEIDKEVISRFKELSKLKTKEDEK